MLRLRFFFFALAALALFTGCHAYALSDDVDVEFNFSPLAGPSDELHLPYVQGALVGFWVQGVDEKDQKHFTIESDDPSVMRVDVNQEEGAPALGTALKPGTATLRVL